MMPAVIECRRPSPGLPSNCRNTAVTATAPECPNLPRLWGAVPWTVCMTWWRVDPSRLSNSFRGDSHGPVFAGHVPHSTQSGHAWDSIVGVS